MRCGGILLTGGPYCWLWWGICGTAGCFWAVGGRKNGAGIFVDRTRIRERIIFRCEDLLIVSVSDWVVHPCRAPADALSRSGCTTRPRATRWRRRRASSQHTARRHTLRVDERGCTRPSSSTTPTSTALTSSLTSTSTSIPSYPYLDSVVPESRLRLAAWSTLGGHDEVEGRKLPNQN